MGSDIPDDQAPLAGISPDLLRAAFSGDRAAFSEILKGIVHFFIPDGAPRAEALAVAEFIARGLAATGDANDATVMADLILTRASIAQDPSDQEYGFGEAIASLNAAADRGDERAAMHLSGPVILNLPRAAFDLAKTLRTEAHR